MLKTYIFILLSLIIIFPSTGISQSFIRGNVYFHDSHEPAAGCSIIMLHNMKPDSVIPRYLIGIELDDISDIEGSFDVKLASNDSIDLLIHFLGYRNTIIKNIPANADTIDLYRVPLFVDDYIYAYETIVYTKKYLWGLIKRQGSYSDIMGTEGPFSYKKELMIVCEKHAKEKMLCVKGLNGIEIDYNDIKLCGSALKSSTP